MKTETIKKWNLRKWKANLKQCTIVKYKTMQPCKVITNDDFQL